MKIEKLHFIAADDKPEAQAALGVFKKRFGQVPLENADVVVMLSGDGGMLHHMNKYQSFHIPFFGLNYGHRGFLMNGTALENILERISTSVPHTLYPLKYEYETTDGRTGVGYAFNDVYMERMKLQQVCRLRVQTQSHKIYEKEELYEPYLDGNGVIVTTPLGSTAYHYNEGGRVFSMHETILGITPIGRRERAGETSLRKEIPDFVKIYLNALEIERSPVAVVGDNVLVENVKTCTIEHDKTRPVVILAAQGSPFYQRIVNKERSSQHSR